MKKIERLLKETLAELKASTAAAKARGEADRPACEALAAELAEELAHLNGAHFPSNFKVEEHHIPGASAWVLYGDDAMPVISIVGGADGLYGDGVTTFEMWDLRESDPTGWLSAEEINEYLQMHPID